MSSEKALRKYLKDKINGHVIQIESHATAVGVPDTNYCLFNGVEGWIELKFVRDNRKIQIRTAQKSWFRKRIKCGHSRLYFAVRRETKGGLKENILVRVKDLEHLEFLFSNPFPRIWKEEAVCTWAVKANEKELNIALGEDND